MGGGGVITSSKKKRRWFAKNIKRDNTIDIFSLVLKKEVSTKLLKTMKNKSTLFFEKLQLVFISCTFCYFVHSITCTKNFVHIRLHTSYYLYNFCGEKYKNLYNLLLLSNICFFFCFKSFIQNLLSLGFWVLGCCFLLHLSGCFFLVLISLIYLFGNYLRCHSVVLWIHLFSCMGHYKKYMQKYVILPF